MKRFVLAISIVVILGVGGLVHAGYVICYRMVASGETNVFGRSMMCAEIVQQTEVDGDNASHVMCPRGTVRRFYWSYHNIGNGLELCR